MRPTRKKPAPKTTARKPSVAATPPSAKKLTEIAEDVIRGNPLKAIGQAAAAGYAMRFLPLRTLLMLATQVAAPILCIAGLWKAVDALDRRSRSPAKKIR